MKMRTLFNDKRICANKRDLLTVPYLSYEFAY